MFVRSSGNAWWLYFCKARLNNLRGASWCTSLICSSFGSTMVQSSKGCTLPECFYIIRNMRLMHMHDINVDYKISEWLIHSLVQVGCATLTTSAWNHPTLWGRRGKLRVCLRVKCQLVSICWTHCSIFFGWSWETYVYSSWWMIYFTIYWNHIGSISMYGLSNKHIYIYTYVYIYIYHVDQYFPLIRTHGLYGIGLMWIYVPVDCWSHAWSMNLGNGSLRCNPVVILKSEGWSKNGVTMAWWRRPLIKPRRRLLCPIPSSLCYLLHP